MTESLSYMFDENGDLYYPDPGVDPKHKNRVSIQAVETGAMVPWYDQILAQRAGGADIAVIDTRGDGQIINIPRLQTWSHVRQYFGCNVDRSQGRDKVLPGQDFLELIAVYARTGPMLSINKVIDKSGRVLANVLGLSSWPGTPGSGGPPHNSNDQGKTLNPNYSHSGYFDAGWSNGDGDFSVHLGSNGWVGQSGGVFRVWFSRSPDAELMFPIRGSDALINIGAIPEVDHFTIAGIWQWKTKGSGTPGPDPDPDPGPGPVPIPGHLHTWEFAIDGVIRAKGKFEVETTIKMIQE